MISASAPAVSLSSRSLRMGFRWAPCCDLVSVSCRGKGADGDACRLCEAVPRSQKVWLRCFPTPGLSSWVGGESVRLKCIAKLLARLVPPIQPRNYVAYCLSLCVIPFPERCFCAERSVQLWRQVEGEQHKIAVTRRVRNLEVNPRPASQQAPGLRFVVQPQNPARHHSPLLQRSLECLGLNSLDSCAITKVDHDQQRLILESPDQPILGTSTYAFQRAAVLHNHHVLNSDKHHAQRL
mmetsp:Transcript_8515/g.19889  ORF Transcript_8515/g.19889 Transcript_8515/m.19889 type:complete len:238 (+) Transcript_8515:750-1463(+)